MTASAYTIEKGDSQYLVSASHVFKSPDVKELQIFHDGVWKTLPIQVAYNSYKVGDTIVFKLPFDISPRYPVTYGTGGIYLASWCYFLGFPLGLSMDSGDLNNKFPFPFVKAALISALDGTQHGLNVLFFDGHNNKGFSGGPVVWAPKPGAEYRIIGTVSGYLAEFPTASGTEEAVDLFEVNAGIIRAYWIKEIFDFIK